MGIKLNKVPINEKELNKLLQEIYSVSKENYELRKESNFMGILEIIMSEPNIISAIHKIKSNKGSNTSGVDGKVIQNYLDKNYDEVIELVQNSIKCYKAKDIKRVWIPKPGKNEKRPLGIPVIIDRIIQQCIKNILEPIAEGQFFEHSYGFRPMRNTQMAVARIKRINWTSKCYWAVEGDIKGFFDNINHNVMIKSLWGLGVRDKRVLCIIKEMLKAGIMNECKTSELGTPQGGVLSPLLANIYLNKFDNHITGDFERKKLRKPKTRRDGELTAMRNHSNLKTAYYIRYADDWVILTDNKEHAEKLKYKAKRYLRDSLKLELSDEKTLITNVTSNPIRFLGVEIRLTNKNGRLVNKVTPDGKRFKDKMKFLKREIFYLRKISTQDKDRLIQNITRVNSEITGIMNYYSMCDQLSVVVRKYAWLLKYTGYKSLKKHGAKWVRAKNVSNLIGLHSGHNAHIPAVKYNHMYIGLTDLAFCKWINPIQKNQKETPYTDEGRELYYKRMRRKGLKSRVDEVNTSEHAMYLRMSKSKLYNFEYFMNRPYAYNRDKGKCRVCGGYVEPKEVHTHHIEPTLPKNEVNRVKNLATTHLYCHNLIHSKEIETEKLSDKTVKNLKKFREKLSDSFESSSPKTTDL